MSKRFKQVWADPEFVRRLERIKFQRMANGDRTESITKLTRKMTNSKKFRELEEELLNFNPSIGGFRYD